MIVSAITFDQGLGTPASQTAGDGVFLSLSDASGLAPLTLPEAFLRGQTQQPASPSSDAVRRFENAMSAGPKLTSYIAASMASRNVPEVAVYSRGAAETRRIDGAVVAERPVVERDVQGVVVEAPVAVKTIVPNNPVNLVNPVQTNVVNPLQANPNVEEVVEAVDSRGGAEARRVDGAVVVERPAVEQPVAERPVVDRPVVGRDVQGVVVEEPATAKTVVPNNPVNPVNSVQTTTVNPVQTNPVGDNLVNVVQEEARPVDSRGGAESRRVEGAEEEKAVAAAQHVVVAPSSVEAPAPQSVQIAPEVAIASAESARTEAIVETVNKVVEAVAGQIVVTPALTHGEGNVRITLKPTVLDGSEISLTAKDGALTVAIVPTTPEAERLASAALPRLETALAEHVSAFRLVAVAVATKKGKSDETT